MAEKIYVGTSYSEFILGRNSSNINDIDIIYGRGGNDKLFGRKGVDYLYGENGND